MRSAGPGLSGWDETRMISSLRAGNSRAMIVFSEHFTPRLLERAIRSGFGTEESRDLVTNFLTEWLISFATGELHPRSLHSYVCGSFSHFIAHEAARRDREREEQSLLRIVTEPDGARIVAESCSEHSLRASGASEDIDSAKSSRELRLFAGMLTAALTDEERTLLRGVVEEIPRREIAAILGVSYSNAGTMLSRLRVRIREEAAAVAARMPIPERAVVESFLRRIERAEPGKRAKPPASPSSARGHFDGGYAANG